MNAFYHSHAASCGESHTLAVSSSAVNFVAGDFTVPSAPYVRVQAQLGDVYVTYDGTTPSASNGEIIPANTPAYFLLKDLLNMKFIRASGDAQVFAQPCILVAPSTAVGL